MNEMDKAIKMIVEGRVQGVGYRHYIYSHARQLGIKGYVKNMDDGHVEILAIADNSTIADFLKIARKGPSFSWVYNIQCTYVNLHKEYNEFEILYS